MPLKKVLVVAAHPDDEILGCGGTMARHASEGDEVNVVFMADGVTSRSDKTDFSDEINKRKQAAKKACAVVAARQPQFLDLSDNQMDKYTVLEITQKLESVIDQIKPEIIYTHHSKDLNVDHQITHQAVMTACRPQPNSYVSEIYSFEILSSTGWAAPTAENTFIPNTFIDISKQWKKKVEALHCYDDELKSLPHARSYRSIEALATYRGASVGLGYAEAFQLERKVVNA